MKKRLALGGVAAAAILTASVGVAPADAAPRPRAEEPIRFATYNASLNRNATGDLEADLSNGDNVQAQAVAETIQLNRPDVLLINEFDYVEGHRAVDLFRDNYLKVSQNGADPIDYPYFFVAPSNTGIDSGHDLNRDGRLGTGDDAFGFGLFPGQYGMVVLSKYPIDTENIRTFQKFLWKDIPGAMLPDDPATAAPNDWYSAEVLQDFRLSSKSHWDVPIKFGRGTVHVLASHPTPPSFDGPEKRNKTRNRDEIRFWADYVTPRLSRYIYDDKGEKGGLKPADSFVIMGDLNSDPLDGDSIPGAAQQLLNDKRIVDPMPTSAGAPEAGLRQGGANLTHQGDSRYDTADFNDNPAPGNLRVDYVLPSRKNLRPVDTGVFWPVQADPVHDRLVGDFPFPASDHRLVWLDVEVG